MVSRVRGEERKGKSYVSEFYFGISTMEMFWNFIKVEAIEHFANVSVSLNFSLSVQFSHSVMSLRPHGLQHTRLPCPSPAPRSLLKLMSIKAVMPSTILSCHPLLLPSIFPSIRVFSNESVLCIMWPFFTLKGSILCCMDFTSVYYFLKKNNPSGTF